MSCSLAASAGEAEGMCLASLRGAGAEVLAVLAADLCAVAALGAVVANTVLVACVLRWRPCWSPLLLCLACADLLAGAGLALRLLAEAVDPAAAAPAALQLSAATASVLSVGAVAVGARLRSNRAHYVLVAGVWSTSLIVGPAPVLLGGRSYYDCSLSSTSRLPTSLLLWACLTHSVVVAALVASWRAKRPSPQDSAPGDPRLGAAAVAACYGLCWLPYAALSLLKLAKFPDDTCCPGVLQDLFFGLGTTNYALKPFLYAWCILGRRTTYQLQRDCEDVAT
ncbi:G-protein coupled receptor 6-like [Bacillus rossius redtenbacheri]|uniref:G-protein coupled receptor 6-like n=1 Tax=Bacillus rossius redtenbacheri TaxID=93214 RepID=UPI002FDE1457